MNTRIYIWLAMVSVTTAMSTRALAQASQRAALVAGAATLNNGSVVTLGQPFAGTARAGDGSVSLSMGIIPTFAPPPVTISPSVTMDNGHFRLGFYLTPGRTWIVEGSTNLTDWSPVQTNTAATSWVEFEDFTAFLYPFRFYRVRLP